MILISYRFCCIKRQIIKIHYNSNILKAAVAAHAGDAENPKIIAIGKKAVEYFEKRDYELVGSYPYLAENVKTAHCADIARAATEMFSAGEVDEVVLFYTAFVSALVQTPEQIKLLPILRKRIQ